ncbi:MAG: SURF1 family protein [Chloroflexota bacterium]|jgi:surfeit locus 1 family protein
MWKIFLKPRWMLTTLLVFAGVGVLIRLGIWQLERLAWRQEFNARVSTQLAAQALDLNAEIPHDELHDMEYRAVVVSGTYDPGKEILLRNHVWEGQLGYRVLTPLKISGSAWMVYVDRGWIPYEHGSLSAPSRFQETGIVLVRGVIRRSQEKPDFGGVPDPTLAPGQERLEVWSVVNLDRIAAESGLTLLPVWVQQSPDAAHDGLPYRSLPEIEITEGPHMGYALQWFTFAAILGFGYPVFVRRHVFPKRDPDNDFETAQAESSRSMEKNYGG